MSKEIKTYILAPTRDAPPDGPIVLGNLISSPKFPEERQSTEPPPPLEGGNRVYEAHKEGWRDSQAHGRTVGGGFFGEFLEMIGLGGGDIDGSRTHTKSTGLAAKALDTYWFNPDLAYLRRSLQDPGVQAYLDVGHSWRSQPLFMITGIMVARGASETVSTLKERGFHTQIGADLSTLGAPVTVGPKFDLHGKREHSGGFDKASDFVLGYRLKWLKVKCDGSVKSGQYNKAATYTGELTATKDADGNVVFEPQHQEITVGDDGATKDSGSGELDVEQEDVDAKTLDSTSGMTFDDDDGTWACLVLP